MNRRLPKPRRLAASCWRSTPVPRATLSPQSSMTAGIRSGWASATRRTRACGAMPMGRLRPSRTGCRVSRTTNSVRMVVRTMRQSSRRMAGGTTSTTPIPRSTSTGSSCPRKRARSSSSTPSNPTRSNQIRSNQTRSNPMPPSGLETRHTSWAPRV